MPAITATDIGQGYSELVETTLDGATDTLTASGSKTQFLTLRNPTGGILTPVISGDAASSVEVPGVGSVDVSGGVSQAIGAGESWTVRLGSIKEYLEGSVSIASGAALIATLIE